ncbi:hypothetical protein M3Y99_00474400 [Aphelenchoides fujianensis]|nr:hypothetical protein M3Y99_00474400 [Aphelenchoides fujianensis]
MGGKLETGGSSNERVERRRFTISRISGNTMGFSSNYCCCQYHVHCGSLFIGILCTILSLLSLAFGSVGYGVGVNQKLDDFLPKFLSPYAHYLFGFAIGGLIETILLLLCSVLLVVGNRARKPALYWPWIVFAFLHLFFSLLRLLLFVFVLIYTATQEIKGMSKADREHSFLFLTLLTSLLIVLFSCELYFVFVVIRGRRFLVEEQNTQKVIYREQYGGGEYAAYFPHLYNRRTDYPWAGHRPNSTPSYVYY